MKGSLIVLLLMLTLFVRAEPIQVVTENWRPYNYEENGVVKGKSTDIVRAVLERAGLTYGIEVLPWARAYDMALSRPNVLIYTIIRVPPREDLFKWVRPLGQSGETSLYRLKTNSKVDAKLLEDAKHFSVVTNRDSMDHIMLKRLGFTNVDVASSVGDAIRMFFGGRTEFIAFDNAVIADEFKSAGFDVNNAEPVLTLFRTPPYMAFSKATSDATVEKVQRAYDELVQAGRIAAMD